MATPCEKKPWICEPRDIKMVAFDADDTIWRISPYAIASSIRGPFKKIDEDTLEVTDEPLPTISSYEEPTTPPKPPVELRWSFEEERFKPVEPEVKEIADELIGSLSKKDRELLEISTGVTGEQIEPTPLPPAKNKQWWKATPPKLPKPKAEYAYKPRKITIKLMPGFRDTLDRLDKMGIKKTIISLNTPGSVKRIIDAFGLSDKFVEITDSWEEKGKVFAKQTETLKINPCNALFVDNTQGHVESVIPHGGLGLVYDKDITQIAKILDFIKG